MFEVKNIHKKVWIQNETYHKSHKTNIFKFAKHFSTLLVPFQFIPRQFQMLPLQFEFNFKNWLSNHDVRPNRILNVQSE